MPQFPAAALRVRQCAEEALGRRHHRRALGDGVRAVVRPGDRVRLQLGATATIGGAQAVVAASPGGRGEPPRDRVALDEVRHPQPRGEEGLLHHVVDLGRAVEDPADDGPEHALVPADERGERPVVPGGGTGDERPGPPADGDGTDGHGWSSVEVVVRVGSGSVASMAGAL
nr:MULTISPECIES: hypothetical protein [unclassified Curtobacterium]